MSAGSSVGEEGCGLSVHRDPAEGSKEEAIVKLRESLWYRQGSPMLKSTICGNFDRVTVKMKK